MDADGGPVLASDADAAWSRDWSWDSRPLRVSSPVPPATWAAVVAADPAALPFHLPQWRDAVCRGSGWQDASRVYETPQGRQLVLPMARQAIAPGVYREASWPAGWGVGGVLAPGGATPAEVEMVWADLTRSRAIDTAVRGGFAAAPAWPAPHGRSVVMVPRSVHVAHFSGDCFDGYWAKAVARKVRAAIRSSVSQQQDAGFTIAKGNTPQLVDDFYQVYLRWADWRASQRRIPRPLARWRASRLETFAKFAAVAAELGGHCHLSVAHWQGRPVGAVWCLRAGETAIGWRAYTDRTVPTRFRVFETLAAAAMRDAFEAGCRHFELGESAGQPGLAVIKERLGGREHLFAEYHFERLPLTAARLARHRVQGRAETWLLRHAPPRPGTAPPAPGDLSAPAAARRAGKLSHVMG